MNITWIGSPNFDKNRQPINRIVIHWFGDSSTTSNVISGVDAQFKKANGTSAHYAVEKTTVHQYVREDHVAYHAGNYAMNQRSLGIEHSAGPNRQAAASTYATSAQLVKELCIKYNIPIDREHIIKHSQVKATQCPGTVDIDRIISLARQLANEEPDMGTITIDTTLYERLVGNSTAKKEVAQYLNIDNPDEASSERIINVIGGLKSEATSLRNDLANTRAELKNREDQVSRLKTQLLNSEKLRKDLQDNLAVAIRKIESNKTVYEDQLTVLNGQLEACGKSKIPLIEQAEKDALEIANLKKQAVQGMRARDLIVYGVKKLLRMAWDLIVYGVRKLFRVA